MAIQIYSDEDDESDRVLPDGDVLRVPLHMMDGLQRAVALGTRGDGGEPLVVDGLGQRSHAPGFVYLKARRVILFFWPTRASSANQISIVW
jgi:hypothetical protein